MTPDEIITNGCSDIDECERPDACPSNSTCFNSVGSYSCICDPGFSFNDDGECEDINECDAVVPPCTFHSTCHNNDGSYTCECDDGYFKVNDACLDIDECQDPDICGDNASCSNFNGWFDCKCLTGYQMNPEDEECSDIDECETGDHKCSLNAGCKNSDGSYFCTCKDGYFGNGFSCTDKNECSAEGDNDCDANAVCENYHGGYSCECNDGYEGDGFTCEDVNECKGEHRCPNHSRCINTVSSYHCECHIGFTDDGSGGCADINECEDENVCGENSLCMNDHGSFTCQCKVGFAVEGKACVNVNECHVINCGPDATCVDTYGSYKCVCDTGYTAIESPNLPIGSVCMDVDECLLGLDDCDSNSLCENTDGSYSCSLITTIMPTTIEITTESVAHKGMFHPSESISNQNGSLFGLRDEELVTTASSIQSSKIKGSVSKKHKNRKMHKSIKAELNLNELIKRSIEMVSK